MLAIILAAATASLAPPPEPLKTQLQSAIWADLELNALIGSGNWLASLWYNAGNARLLTSTFSGLGVCRPVQGSVAHSSLSVTEALPRRSVK